VGQLNDLFTGKIPVSNLKTQLLDPKKYQYQNIFAQQGEHSEIVRQKLEKLKQTYNMPSTPQKLSMEHTNNEQYVSSKPIGEGRPLTDTEKSDLESHQRILSEIGKAKEDLFTFYQEDYQKNHFSGNKKFSPTADQLFEVKSNEVGQLLMTEYESEVLASVKVESLLGSGREV
jgi:hypothetical protein